MNIHFLNKRFFAVILLVFLFVCSLAPVYQAQIEPLPTYQHLLNFGNEFPPVFSEKSNPYGFRYYYDIGINKKLEGTPYIAVFFLDDDESSWTEESVYKFYDKLITPSVAFLEESAASWGVDLDFHVECDATYQHPDRPLKYDGIVEPNRDKRASRDIMEQTAASFGFSSEEELHEYLQRYSGQEEIIYVFMLNKAGQTHARIFGNSPEAMDYDGQLYEYCIIYTGFEEGVEDVGNHAVAHEILHLYGAEDYYTPQERYAIASVICPDDIMLCMHPDVSYYEVTQITAYSVGWFNFIPDAFYAIA